MAGPAVHGAPRVTRLALVALIAGTVAVCALSGPVAAQESSTVVSPEKTPVPASAAPGNVAGTPEAKATATVVPAQADAATPPAESPQAKAAPPKDHAELEARLAKWKQVDWQTLAEKDQLKFIQQLQQKCDETLIDLTGTFFKQERIKGKLGKEEAMIIKCRTSPFAVYMKYVKGDKDREVLYAEGKYDNKIQAHPGGAMGALFQVQIKPDSDLAKKGNLRPITMAGMVNMLHTVVPQFELAKANDDLKTAYLGQMDVGGRKAYAIKRILPQKKEYPCHELVFFVDVEALVPVGADSYGWDGQLESSYRYTDFKINPGLSDLEFDKANKAYNF